MTLWEMFKDISDEARYLPIIANSTLRNQDIYEHILIDSHPTISFNFNSDSELHREAKIITNMAYRIAENVRKS